MKRILTATSMAAAVLGLGLPVHALPSNLIRARTVDDMTFDQMAHLPTMPINALGDARGRVFEHRYRTHDGLANLYEDGRYRTVDSSGAFLIGELERLDQTLHLPLAAVSWSRDIDLREDVSLADEISSFMLTTFGSAGNLGTGNGIRNGKAWIGKTTDQIGGVGVDTGKIANPLTPWALELKFTILELESAAKMGRPIDDQKYEALKLKHQMDIDEMVYVGDGSLNVGGLLNSALVTNVSNVVAGASTFTAWSTKTPAEILSDVNSMLQSAWAAAGYAEMPHKIGIPPTQFGYISTQLVSTAGGISILKYLSENNIVKSAGKGEVQIVPMKWLVGAGVGGTLGTAGTVDRMIAYTQKKNFVRYPMTALQRTATQFESIYHKMSYYCRLGVVEVVYPETIAYRDGI